jgi:hypothetical protein
MSDLNQGTPGHNQDLKAVLPIALDHAWRWYDFRYRQAIHVLNFFTLSATVLAAAYVSAFNAGHRGLATLIALLAGLLTASTYVVGTRLAKIAHLADEPLREIQRELAGALDIDTMRLIERSENRPSRLSSSGAVSNIAFPIVTVVCLTAAGVAWFGH